MFLWIGIVLHGLFVEAVSYWMPDIDSFWHAQGIFTFIGQRLPLYIILLCKYDFSAIFYNLQVHDSRVERKTSVSQMVVFPQT